MHQFKKDDRVRFKGMGDACHAKLPQYYPEDGTIGIVFFASPADDEVYVQWPKGSTSGNDLWWAWLYSLELVADDPT